MILQKKITSEEISQYLNQVAIWKHGIHTGIGLLCTLGITILNIYSGTFAALISIISIVSAPIIAYKFNTPVYNAISLSFFIIGLTSLINYVPKLNTISHFILGILAVLSFCYALYHGYKVIYIYNLPLKHDS